MRWQDAVATFGVSEIVARAYEVCEPLAAADSDNGYPVLWVLDAILGQAEQLESYVRTANGRSGWSNMLDADAAPADALDWLAEFVGTQLSADLSTADKRTAIKTHSSWQRGTVASLRAALQQVLTGTKRVEIIERWNGNAYQIAIWTYAAEAPSPAKVNAAIAAQKPAGLVTVGATVQPGMTWYDVSRQFASWSAFAAAGTETWAQRAAQVPSY